MRDFKVLLILPPTTRIRYNISGVYPLPPLGLSYIASVLKKNDYHVEILDMPALKLEEKDLYLYVQKNDYLIYGISCNIFTLKSGISIAGLLKGLQAKAKIVLGGRCNAFSSELIFEYGANFDIVVKNEGEEAMLKLCNALRENTNWREDLDKIPGISYKTDYGIVTTSSASYIDLDSLPFPARELLPNRYYRLHPPFGVYPPVTLMETSRGCLYNCIFCTLPQPLRERSILNVVEEIKEVIVKFKTREVHFVDPNFTYNQARIKKLCHFILENNIKFKWTCKTRPDLVSKELLEIMSKAGCYMISYGVESGSQKVLDSLHKYTKLDDIENAFSLTKNAGIRTLAYVLLGSPGEDNSSFRATIKLIEKITPDFVLYGELLPDPNSSLTKNVTEKGDISYKDLAEFYLNGNNYKLDRKNIVNLSRQEIQRWIIIANRSFYFRIGYIVYRLRNIKNFRDFINLILGICFLFLDKMKSKKRIF